MTVLVAILCAVQGCKCFYCQQPFSRVNRWTRDHVFPRVLGGKATRNIVLACQPCNHAKGDRMPTQAEVMRAAVLHESAVHIAEIYSGAPCWSEGRSAPSQYQPGPSKMAEQLRASSG